MHYLKHQDQLMSIAYFKKRNQQATRHEKGQVNIWDDQTNTIIHQLYQHQGYVSKLQFDSTGKLYSGGKDGALRIWDFEKFQQNKKSPDQRIQLFSVELIQLKINEKNRLIVMTSLNQELIVYDFTAVKLIFSTRNDGRINAVSFDQNGKFMAIGGTERFIITFKIEDEGNSIKRSQQLGEHPEAITSLAYQGQSLLISVLKNGHIFIWNHMRSTLLKKIQNISPISCLSIYNKKFACMSSEDGKIRIIDLDQGKQVKVFRYKQMCHKFVTRTASNSDIANGNFPLLYAVCKDGNILKWNLYDLNRTSNKLHSGSSSSLSILNQNKKAIKFARKAMNEDGTIMAQVQGQRLIKINNLNEHTQQMIVVQKCPDIIQGVQFIQSQQKQQKKSQQKKQAWNIILLLKSGQFWSLNKQCVHDFAPNDPTNIQLSNSNLQGELYYIKQKEQLFFRSGIKKIKQIKKPTQSVIDEVTIGG